MPASQQTMRHLSSVHVGEWAAQADHAVVPIHAVCEKAQPAGQKACTTDASRKARLISCTSLPSGPLLELLSRLDRLWLPLMLARAVKV